MVVVKIADADAAHVLLALERLYYHGDEPFGESPVIAGVVDQMQSQMTAEQCETARCGIPLTAVAS